MKHGCIPLSNFPLKDPTASLALCSLCGGILVKAVTSICGHGLSPKCFAALREKSELCPMENCGKPFDMISKRNFAVEAINRAQTGFCTQPLCDFEGLFADFLYHLCSEEKIECVFRNCGRRIKRRLFETHLNSCEKLPKFCEFCTDLQSENPPVPGASAVDPAPDNLGSHILNCKAFKVICEFCGEKTAFSEERAHRENNCVGIERRCILEKSLCQFAGNIRQLKEHKAKFHPKTLPEKS